MRIALLGNANTLHTLRWANALAQRDVELHLISAHPFSPDLAPSIGRHQLTPAAPWGYVAAAGRLRRVLDRLRPDVLNAHYASGYGTLAASCGYRPLCLSVWGSDVFDFPRKSPLHRRLIQRNLSAADCVVSISHVMARQCRSLCPGLADLRVVSWGVDTTKFAPRREKQRAATITIGTVKVLANKYGVDTLIQGFAEARRRLAGAGDAEADRLRLRIVGDGPQRRLLTALAEKEGVAAVTEFVGAVSHDEVPAELNKLDAYVAVSRLDSESFGVAIIEASACGLPVIVSDAGGLPEVVVDGETGFVVPRENPVALASRLCETVADPAIRARLGEAGRRHVATKYEWENDVNHMLDVYQSLSRGIRRAARAA